MLDFVVAKLTDALYDPNGRTYREQFAYGKLQLTLTEGISLNLVALLISLINFTIYSTIQALQSSPQSTRLDNRLDEVLVNKPGQGYLKLARNIISCIAGIVSWYGFASFALMPAWYWSYQVLEFWPALLMAMAILYARYFWGLFYHKMSKSLPYVIVLGVLIPIYCYGVAIVKEGSCECYFEDTYGIYDNTYSTRLIREYQLPVMCPPGPPCHVYANLAEDASTSVFITAHTSTVHSDVTICWQLADLDLDLNSDQIRCAEPKKFDVPRVEPKGQRYIHSAYLGELTADTLYKIIVVYNDSNTDALSEQHDFVPMDYHPQLGGYVAVIEQYRTLPDYQSNKTIRIVMGGDAGYNKISAQVAKNAAAYKPDVIVLAGDMAYDNGLQTCYYVWDQFLSMFEPIYEQKGSIVPFIFGVGNHDLGKDSESTAVVIVDEYAPLYYHLFPQHSIRGPNGTLIPEVPEIPQRKTYFYTKLGRLLLVSLDSGYQETYYGEQLAWWKKLNDENPQYLKVANYHNPIYWSAGAPDESNLSGNDYLVILQIKDGLTYWIPEIDRSNYLSVWENHVHVFKRTFPLRGGLQHENGTVFLGDGCWGVPPGDAPVQNDTSIFDTYNGTTNHFWLVDLYETTVNYTAVDLQGLVIDKAYQKLENYYKH